MTPGTRLGPYEVTAPLGAGAMGEVYRAHDTKLNREVALKILPDAVATDPDRLARFTREAQTLAVLNHPSIGVYQIPRQLVDFHPVWSATGGELIFTGAATAGQMVSLGIATAGGVTFGTPARFPASVTGDCPASQPRAWDILPDGRLIGIVSGTEDATRSSISQLRLVLNWFEELKQKVPVR